MFFEQAREQAEREFTANNKDALVRIDVTRASVYCVCVLIVFLGCV